MKHLLKLIVAAALLPLAALHAASQPNVLFIAVDDLRPDLGCYGNKIAKSPNIDRIAARGTVFNRAYVSQAVCSPSRTAILTGLRPDTTRVWDLETHFRVAQPDCITLPQHFKANGYHTAALSKVYHAGLEDGRSWNEPHWYPKGRAVDTDPVDWTKQIVTRHAVNVSEFAEEQAGPDRKNGKSAKKGPSFEVSPKQDDELPDGATAAEAVKRLHDLKSKGKPFFLAVGFLKPHLPFVAPKKYWDLYDSNTIPLPAIDHLPKGAPEFAGHNNSELHNYPGVPKGEPIPADFAKTLRHGYYACISYTDAQIGRVLDALEKEGLADNTIIVLWGDHGWQLGDHGLWHKHTNFELATRAPLLISVPKQKTAGQKCNAPVEFVDVYPTLADLCGLPKPTGLPGSSLKPFIENPATPMAKVAISQYPRSAGQAGAVMGYSIRDERWRATFWRERNGSKIVATELYDEQNDPAESVSLHDKPEHKAVIESLSKFLPPVLTEVPVKKKKGQTKQEMKTKGKAADAKPSPASPTAAASAVAQQPETIKAEAKGGQAIAGVRIEQDPKFVAVAQRFQTDFGVALKLARINSPLIATNYVVTALKAEHLENALQILTWVEAELKRYPAGFVKKHGAKNLVLANAYVSKAAKGATPAYSPTFIAERASGSLLVTVPSAMTPTIEVLGRGYLHYTLFTYLLADVKSPDSPLAPARWKTLESDDSKLETENAKRVAKASNTREGLYKMLWEPFEFGDLTTLAKTDARLKQRMEIVQTFLRTLDPQFDQAFWATLATIPESQRTVCLNDLTDTHSADQIKADPEIQSDLRKLEKQWGFKVLWEPGSPVPPMPAKVRLEYSYFTDKKLHEFKEFIRMVREELEIYPEQITKRLHVKNLYILNDFTFRGSGVAGQGMSWLPQVSFAYGIRTFDPAKATSRDFYRRTIHHEVLHLIDKQFSVEGGPIHGTYWDNLNEPGFAYKVGKLSSFAASQTNFYKDNAKRQGFAEPYGMNIATDDRATLFGRMMTARVADEGRGDQPFLTKLETDKILKAKADRLIEFFQLLKRDLAIPSPSQFYSRLEGVFPPQKDK